MGRTVRRSLMVCVVLGTIVAGCGGDDDDAAGDAGNGKGHGGKDQEMVRYSYDQYWETFDTLASSPEALQDAHYLETFAAGEAMTQARTDFGQQFGQNVVRKVGRWNRHEVKAVEVDGDRATVEDCFVDDSNLGDFVNGQAKDINGATLRLLKVTLERERPSEWKVTQIRSLKTWRFVETDDCP